MHRGDQARRHGRAGRHAAARAAAVRGQRDHGQGTRLQGCFPLGHRVRLGGRIHRIGSRRRETPVVGTVPAQRRCESLRTGTRQNQEHEGAADRSLKVLFFVFHRRITMRWIGKAALIVVAMCVVTGVAFAQQTKLKWAHVYETSEPYHKWSVWAAAEIEKRTNGRYHIDVFPASTLGKESDINQGLTLGTVDIIISGLSFAARTMPRIGVGYYPYTFRDGDHLLKYAKSDVFKGMVDEYRNKTGIQITAMTYYGVRHSTTNRPFNDCSGMKGL